MSFHARISLLSNLRNLRIALGQCCYSKTDRLLNPQLLFLALIFIARPEKPLETVLPSTWNNVRMQMRDTLAHSVVHCHKRSFCLQGHFNRPRQKLDV